MLSLRATASSAVSTASVVLALMVVAPVLHAQSESIPDTIESAYVLSKPTADLTGIVKQGDVLELKKDNVVMCAIASNIDSYNTYKRGKIEQSALNRMKFFTASGSAPTVPTRVFVAGENVLLTGVDVQEKGIRLSLLSEAINGRHYKAYLVFPFPKGHPPAPEKALQAVAEVLSVQAAPQQQSAVTSARTIAIGQSKEQVLAILGQPMTVVQLGGGREVDYFPAMKVTFTNGLVSNVQ